MRSAIALHVMQKEKNVNDPERWVSVVLGSALTAYGLKKRSIRGLALSAAGGALVWRGATGHCSVYEMLGLSSNGHTDRQVSVPYGRGIRVEKAVTINATPEQLYAFWRNVENLPRFMENIEIINDIPNELIAWRSVDGSKVGNAGSVHFEAAPGRGTIVKVVMRYDPPGGVLGAAFAKVLGEDPAHDVQEELRRLKMLIETGEIATTEGQSSGRKAS